MQDHSYEYDLFVIGGGSGGISAARHAAELGKKVAIADFVRPTPHGTTWGLGGDMRQRRLHSKKTYALCWDSVRVKDGLGDGRNRGEQGSSARLEQDGGQHYQTHQESQLGLQGRADWSECEVLQLVRHISGSSHPRPRQWQRAALKVTADKIVIAVGGRPQYPGIPGDKEFGITSDDVFYLKKAPGKTLVVGASYVALECAGFLNALGYDTTVMGGQFCSGASTKIWPIELDSTWKDTKSNSAKTPSPPNRETWRQDNSDFHKAGETKTEEYDTVLFAIGRYALTAPLNLELAGLITEANGKFNVNDIEQTNVPHIYAIGDALYGKLELTPVAIKAGKLLALRLFGGATEKMDYNMVPTTVFTPLEYGAVGYSEDDAKAKWGAENISTFHTEFRPLEWNYNKTKRPEIECYVKILVNKQDSNRVVGYHILAPNAGEMT
eukprot:CAMPEP_0202955948 /NCGR_PEP_ID=MMETSP1396-20130829/472_1 /ASSEMBLY_ACC=CAM_ASM_000872 /TAXON_ID= /ORGANISM="Pseudokeronopsis sp., Strain Brazil" /LENGTH=438 /DNA_ID=CAMNT_0049672729 /DNA_START=24 /DNA_END=1343 /DNA_ORIENTATION=+